MKNIDAKDKNSELNQAIVPLRLFRGPPADNAQWNIKYGRQTLKSKTFDICKPEEINIAYAFALYKWLVTSDEWLVTI